MHQKTCAPNSLFYKVVLAEPGGLSLCTPLYILTCAQWGCTHLYKHINSACLLQQAEKPVSKMGLEAEAYTLQKHSCKPQAASAVLQLAGPAWQSQLRHLSSQASPR